ncbi:MAG: 3-dehydroquinate synthase [Bacteroidales bacterium]|jgi:3-dehydroquinate synthase|nr:3-dehydroquinate synthase [Bacteroidales bacterium]
MTNKLPLLQTSLTSFLNNHPYSQGVILADEKVWQLYPHQFDFLDNLLNIKLFTIKGGESAKTIQQAERLWNEMLEAHIDKNALFINIGGGSISDIGAFVAATYKRGIDYINIPTTLLSMVDAAIGGKSALNVHRLKNSIGLIVEAQSVIQEPAFLHTLPHEELMSGFAELVKYALIADAHLWNELKVLSHINIETLKPEWIARAADFKKSIVAIDLYDKGTRKILNFGHTIGHAFESFLLDKMPISHGHAVAFGMVSEAFLSYQQGILPESDYLQIKQYIHNHYPTWPIANTDFPKILELCQNDKKSENQTVKYMQLSRIGTYPIEKSISEEINSYLCSLF